MAQATKEDSKYVVEQLDRSPGADPVSCINQLLSEQSRKGYRLVAAGGSALVDGGPYFIFKKTANADQDNYLIEELQIHDLIAATDSVEEILEERLSGSWLPVLVMDVATANPIVVYRQAPRICSDARLNFIDVPDSPFQSTDEAVNQELMIQQIQNNLMLACAMEGRSHLILVMVSNQIEYPFEYAVESTSGGVFSIQPHPVIDLIDKRSAGGWEVCGLFEDASMTPTIVFRRSSVMSRAA